jgi:hypothetical protein
LRASHPTIEKVNLYNSVATLAQTGKVAWSRFIKATADQDTGFNTTATPRYDL